MHCGAVEFHSLAWIMYSPAEIVPVGEQVVVSANAAGAAITDVTAETATASAAAAAAARSLGKRRDIGLSLLRERLWSMSSAHAAVGPPAMTRAAPSQGALNQATNSRCR